MNLKLKVFVEGNLSFAEALWQPFTRTNRSRQSPFLIVEMVYCPENNRIEFHLQLQRKGGEGKNGPMQNHEKEVKYLFVTTLLIESF